MQLEHTGEYLTQIWEPRNEEVTFTGVQKCVLICFHTMKKVSQADGAAGSKAQRCERAAYPETLNWLRKVGLKLP